MCSPEAPQPRRDDEAAAEVWGRLALDALAGDAPACDARRRLLTAALRGAGGAGRRAAQAALGSLAYGGAPVHDDEVLAAVEGVGRHGGESLPVLRLLELLADTPRAELAVDVVLDWCTPAASPSWLPCRLELLRHLAAWRPALLPLPRLVAAAEALQPWERQRLLAETIEPRLLATPATLAVELLGRLARTFDGTPRWRLTLGMLAIHPAVPSAVRAWAAARSAASFPAASRLRALLGDAPPRLLLLQNLRLGQGDECIRCGPLLQGFLAAFPTLQATIVTPRPHLWEHPRIAAVDVDDRHGAVAACERPYDVVIELVELATAVPVNHDLAAHEALLASLERAPPALLVRGDQGTTRFLYPTVRLGADELAGPLALDRATARQVYDPCRRLLTELGLPWLPATAASGGASCDPLTGIASRDATRLWSELLPGAAPKALVNPFGGAYPEKGCPADRLDVLAAELAALVAEGYQALVLPTGTPWVGPEVLDALRARLDAATRERVVIAPDPAAAPVAASALALTERSDLAHADRVMRLFKHFAARADLVVAVEGWLGHVAAQLGRPLRLVASLGSYGHDWYPPGEPELASCLSRGAWSHVRESERLVAPRPAAPRLLARRLLESCLEALPGIAVQTTPDALLVAAASPGPTLRAAAATALGRLRPPAIARLRALQLDPHPVVASAAADALLALADQGFPLSVSRASLEASRAIAAQQWQAVLALGEGALPALAAVAAGSSGIIADEARIVLSELLARRVSARRPRPASQPLPAGEA